MPRNNDGSFSRVINWINEQNTNASFTGAKLDSDADDLAQGIEESLDVFGRNGLQGNLNMGGNEIFEVGNPNTPQSAINWQNAYLLGSPYEPPFNAAIDFNNGGIDIANFNFHLKIDNPILSDFLEKQRTWLRFSFIINTPYSKDDVIAAGRFEYISLAIPAGTISGYVVRDTFNATSNNLPSFSVGRAFQMEAIKKDNTWYFREFDNMREGAILYETPSSDYMPSGYKSVSLGSSSVVQTVFEKIRI
ncbi:MAG: hypothetical protein FWE18_03775 [Alphaproteobacteria bacterium]|nr:hypothetical protein [Alphaproteobacteria bacterium]